jgi:hypothetical protein
VPRQHGRAEAHLIGTAHVQFVAEQWAAGQIGAQSRPAGSAALTVTAQDHLVAQHQGGPGGEVHPYVGPVPGATGRDRWFGQVLQSRARGHDHGDGQEGLPPVPAGERDRRRGRPQPERRPFPHLDPQFQDIPAQRAGRAADEVHGLGRPAQDERSLGTLNGKPGGTVGATFGDEGG